MDIKKSRLSLILIIAVIVFIITGSMFVKATYSYFTATVGSTANVITLGKVGAVFCSRDNDGTTYTQNQNYLSENSIILTLGDEEFSNISYGKSVSLNNTTLAIWNTATINQYVRIGLNVYIVDIVDDRNGNQTVTADTSKDYGKYFALGYSQGSSVKEPNSNYFVQSKTIEKYNSIFGDGLYYFVNGSNNDSAFMPGIDSADYTSTTPYDIADSIYMYSKEELNSFSAVNPDLYANYNDDFSEITGKKLQVRVYIETVQADFQNGSEKVSALNSIWGAINSYPYPTRWLQAYAKES